MTEHSDESSHRRTLTKPTFEPDLFISQLMNDIHIYANSRSRSPLQRARGLRHLLYLVDRYFSLAVFYARFPQYGTDTGQEPPKDETFWPRLAKELEMSINAVQNRADNGQQVMLDEQRDE